MATVNPATILHDITIHDIQKILDQVVRSTNMRGGPGILFFDVSYLYNFHVSDMDYISKICKISRYTGDAKPWHDMLERWYNDQTVRNHFGRQIKPKYIVRNLDRIVNEGLEIVAKGLVGQDMPVFKFHALGEGEDIEEALPSDTQLVDQINRIDVTSNPEGGSVTRDGSTIYVVGNHPASLGSALITESGIFDNAVVGNDKMLDHSIFDPGIQHDQHEDSAGSTTVIYMCGI